MSVLDGVRIIELAEDVAGEYAGKLLADFGAEVIKIERPGTGSPTRSMSPIIQGKDGRRESGLFAYLNTNKQSVTLDLATTEGIQTLRGLIASAAGVIDDHDEDGLKALGLTRDRFAADFPSAIFCGISNFGQGAPPDLRVTKSINVMHASGWGYHTPSPYDPTKPPLKGAGRFIVDYDAGIEAALCMMVSLVGRERTGHGEYVDISKQDVLVSRADMLIGRMLAGELYVGDDRAAFEFRGVSGPYRCADGMVYLYMTQPHWRRLIKLVQNAPWTTDFTDYWMLDVTDAAIAGFRKHFGAWLAARPRDQACAEAQDAGIALVQVNDAADLRRSEQLKFRGFFQELDHPILGRALYPTVPYKLSATPTRLRTPAPLLGQHNDALAARPVASPPRPNPKPTPHPVMRPSRGGPLTGIRVLAITKAWAGPYAGKLMAFLGAEVIKVESFKKLDEMRRHGTDDINKGPIFCSLNHQVLSVQLDMKSEKGAHYLREMIAKSDIVLNNLKPGALEKIGLDYGGMRAIKKDIISVSIKMYGSDGPLSSQTGYAPCFSALGGLNSLIGYEGESPLGANQSYGDATAGAATVLATLAALLHRECTGEGQYVDLSATECMSSMIGDCLLEYSLTGIAPRHDGNRHADMAPHGVYPCLVGEWISIAVASDREWVALCDALQAGDLKSDARFATLAERQSHHAEGDEKIALLTAKHHAAVLAAQLRQAGVPAFKSQTSRDMIEDQHLWQRKTYRTVTDAAGKSRPIVGTAWHFSRDVAAVSRGAPLLGEHNEYVYCDVLGLSKQALQDLIAEGVVN